MENEIVNLRPCANQIERELRKILKFELSGFGEIGNSSYIAKHPYSALACGLAVYYPNNSKDKREIIDKFLNDYYIHQEETIEQIGKDKIYKIIEEFKKVVKMVR